MTDQHDVAAVVPTVVDVGLTFPLGDHSVPRPGAIQMLGPTQCPPARIPGSKVPPYGKQRTENTSTPARTSPVRGQFSAAPPAAAKQGAAPSLKPKPGWRRMTLG
jgi:hypothetical protein